MPPCSYVVSFGDIHHYLVETWTTSSQEGIVCWTVILRNLGLFPHASSSTHYELQGGGLCGYNCRKSVVYHDQCRFFFSRLALITSPTYTLDVYPLLHTTTLDKDFHDSYSRGAGLSCYDYFTGVAHTTHTGLIIFCATPSPLHSLSSPHPYYFFVSITDSSSLTIGTLALTGE